MHIQAVLFDLDGTLLNTLDDLTAAVGSALSALSRPPLDRETVRRFVGNGVGKLILRALWHTDGKTGESPHPDYEKCLAEFTAYYDKHNAEKTSLYPGVTDMIESVRALGLKTAVVTNKYDGAAQALRSEFFPQIDVVVGARDGVAPKPSRDGVDKALSSLGVGADKAVLVGDGEVDIATAKNAALPVIAVTWGFRDKPLLQSLAPDAIIDRPCELVPTLKDLNFL